MLLALWNHLDPGRARPNSRSPDGGVRGPTDLSDHSVQELPVHDVQRRQAKFGIRWEIATSGLYCLCERAPVVGSTLGPERPLRGEARRLAEHWDLLVLHSELWRHWAVRAEEELHSGAVVHAVSEGLRHQEVVDRPVGCLVTQVALEGATILILDLMRKSVLEITSGSMFRSPPTIMGRLSWCCSSAMLARSSLLTAFSPETASKYVEARRCVTAPGTWSRTASRRCPCSL